MPPHILFTIDGFPEEDLRKMEACAAGWATWEQIPGDAPDEVFGPKALAADIVIGWPKAEWLRDGRAQLAIVSSHGFDQYQGVGLESKPGFRMCNSRGAYTIAVAEHCVALMLALARQIPMHIRHAQAHQWQSSWDDTARYVELTGARACVVGLGAIGTEIARRLLGLGMRVTGVEVRDVEPLAGIDRLYKPEQLREAAADAQHLAVAVFGGPTTTKLIDGAVLDALPRGSFFYNVSRGSVVDQAALLARLQSGHLAGAGLDVFEEEPLPPEHPLWAMENVLVTPHIAGTNERWPERLRDLIITNLTNYREGRPLANVVMGGG